MEDEADKVRVERFLDSHVEGYHAGCEESWSDADVELVRGWIAVSQEGGLSSARGSAPTPGYGPSAPAAVATNAKMRAAVSMSKSIEARTYRISPGRDLVGSFPDVTLPAFLPRPLHILHRYGYSRRDYCAGDLAFALAGALADG